jgi:radical SAM protein with 4Fe4S-binding SPASM domain
MTENYEEIPKMFIYCRDNNIIPDFDTLQEKGRGAECGLFSQDEKTKTMFKILQNIDKKEYGHIWEISPTYVAGKCERYKQHLYVDRFGNVSPCLGTHLNKIDLGNVKKSLKNHTTLAKIWFNNSLMQKIKKRKYEGKCTRCEHYKKYECNSCLGRYAEVNPKANIIKTIGCWNFEKINPKDKNKLYKSSKYSSERINKNHHS